MIPLSDVSYALLTLNKFCAVATNKRKKSTQKHILVKKIVLIYRGLFSVFVKVVEIFGNNKNVQAT